EHSEKRRGTEQERAKRRILVAWTRGFRAHFNRILAVGTSSDSNPWRFESSDVVHQRFGFLGIAR
ncbi:unnamed protein product, partial [Ilex paraguariensis]